MGIDVAWVDEEHKPHQQVYDPRQCLTRLATSVWSDPSSVCLRFIDAWGDTVFNQAQIPILLCELRLSEQSQADPEIKAHLTKIIQLVERAVERTHTYIKFSGD